MDSTYNHMHICISILHITVLLHLTPALLQLICQLICFAQTNKYFRKEINELFILSAPLGMCGNNSYYLKKTLFKLITLKTPSQLLVAFLVRDVFATCVFAAQSAQTNVGVLLKFPTWMKLWRTFQGLVTKNTGKQIL